MKNLQGKERMEYVLAEISKQFSIKGDFEKENTKRRFFLYVHGEYLLSHVEESGEFSVFFKKNGNTWEDFYHLYNEYYFLVHKEKGTKYISWFNEYYYHNINDDNDKKFVIKKDFSICFMALKQFGNSELNKNKFKRKEP